MRCIWRYETPVGKLGIAEKDGGISHILFEHQPAPPGYETRETPLIREAAAQLAAYFAGESREFDLPLSPEGTAFQRMVWDALCTIEVGETRSYQQMAVQINRPTAVRAVGAANGRNPIPIMIPCHRVIGSNGSLTGYAGGLAMKQYLLEQERKHGG